MGRQDSFSKPVKQGWLSLSAQPAVLPKVKEKSLEDMARANKLFGKRASAAS